MISKLLTVSALAVAALALPDVTVKKLPSGCSSYPGYNSETGESNVFLVEVADSENPAIEGFSNTNDYSIGIGAQGRPFMRWGYINIPSRNDIAKTRLQCFDGVLQAYTDSELTAAGGPTNPQWMPLALSPYTYDGTLLYKVEGKEVSVYEHYIGEDKQPGLFLGGYDDSTTWGFTYIAPHATDKYGSYQMRLIEKSGSVGANETRGFIKIQGS